MVEHDEFTEVTSGWELTPERADSSEGAFTPPPFGSVVKGASDHLVQAKDDQTASVCVQLRFRPVIGC